MKSMEFAVRDTRHLLDLEELPKRPSPPASPAAVSLCGMCLSRIAGKKRTLCCVTLIWNFPPAPSPLWWVPPAAANLRAARLIARFWDVTDGRIAIGGVDIRNLTLKQLADQVSFVTQDNFLFDCSLKENIRLGKPDATEEEVWAAAGPLSARSF